MFGIEEEVIVVDEYGNVIEEVFIDNYGRQRGYGYPVVEEIIVIEEPYGYSETIIEEY